MLGSGINPESFKQDYSGFTRAAEIQAQGLQNLGQSIGGAIESYGEMKKRQQEDERAVQKSKNVAKAIGDLIPDLKPAIQNSLTILDDKELPLSQRKAEAEAISDILNLGIGEIRNRQSMQLERGKMKAEKDYREAQLQAAKDAAIKPTTYEAVLEKIGDGYLSYKKGSDGNKYDDFGNIITDMPAYAAGEPLEVYSAGKGNVAPNVIDAGLNMPTFGPAGDVPVVYNANGEPMLLPAPVGTFDTPNPLIPIDPSVIDAGIALNAGQAAPVVGEPPASIARRPELKSRIIQSGEEIGSEMTMEQYNSLIAQGRNVRGKPLTNGNVFVTDMQPFPPREGTRTTVNRDGSIVTETIALDGKEDKAQRAEAYKAGKATELMKDLNLLESGVTEMAPGIAGAAGRMIAEQVPATEQADRKAIIDRVKSTLTVAELQAMRNSSPTGASLGNISNTDVGLLKDSATALSNAQNPEAFKRELVRLKNLQHEILYGSEQVLKENLQKGKITQSEFDESMRMRPSEFINDQGVVASRATQPVQGGVELSPEIQEMKRQMEARMREAEARKQAQ